MPLTESVHLREVPCYNNSFTVLRNLKTGKFTVAVNRNFRNANGETGVEVSYFDCEAYGEYAAKIQGKCVKGAGVRIVGRLKQNRWKDGGGKNCSKVFVVVEHIEFLKKSAGKEEIL